MCERERERERERDLSFRISGTLKHNTIDFLRLNHLSLSMMRLATFHIHVDNLVN